MEDKEVIEMLTRMMEKYPLGSKEKEAVLEAIGILSWTKLGRSRIKNIAKAQRDRRAKMLEDKPGDMILH